MKMKMLAAAVMAAALMPTVALAEYPERPVRLVVNLAAGGSNDLVARLLADGMTATLKQPVLVENRPGAGGTIGAAAVVNATADGYTLLFSNPATISEVFNKNPPYEVRTDLAPVANVFVSPVGFFINSQVPATTLKEFVDYAKRQPGKLNFGATSGFTLMLYALLKQATGVDLVTVNYKGSAPTVTALLSNEVQTAFDSALSHKANVETGRVRVLFIAHDRRLKSMPSAPTAAEAGYPSILTASSVGLFATRGSPNEAVQKLNRAANETQKNPNFVQRIDELGGSVTGGTSEEWARDVKDQLAHWHRIAKLANYEPH